jgi:SAM-dependent methyltransferase
MPSLIQPSGQSLPPVSPGFLGRLLVPARRQQSEWLDEPGNSRETLAGNFKDIAFLNRWFGGWSLVDKSLRPFLPQPGPATLTLLDLAAGAADVPLALARHWQKRGISLKITAVDIDPIIVELAREAARREKYEDFEAITADAFEYTWPEGQHYDFVTCSLAFHHFTPERCVEMLRLMSRLTGQAFVVNDLRRSWFGWFGSRLLTLLVARHPFTRHDGPLSVLRAYTTPELAALALSAGLDPAIRLTIRRGPFSRLALVGERRGTDNVKR